MVQLNSSPYREGSPHLQPKVCIKLDFLPFLFPLFTFFPLHLIVQLFLKAILHPLVMICKMCVPLKLIL